MTGFNVGDKVRITQASRIQFGGDLTNGKTYEVVDLQAKHDGYIEDAIVVIDDSGARLSIVKSEYFAIKRTNDTLERLTKAEAKIAALEAEVAKLKAGSRSACAITAHMEDEADQVPRPFPHNMARDIAKSVAARTKTPNQRRADVIKRAQDFVADLERRAESDDRNGDGNWLFNGRTTKLTFHVNAEKGVVTALAHGRYGNKKLYDKAFAKCHPNDVFNADIGKGIAAGKLYGVDIPREFLDAPNPTEVVDYMKVVTDDGLYTVTPGNYCEDTHGTKECQADSIYALEGTIIEDTDAVYV